MLYHEHLLKWLKGSDPESPPSIVLRVQGPLVQLAAEMCSSPQDVVPAVDLTILATLCLPLTLVRRAALCRSCPFVTKEANRHHQHRLG